MRILCLGILTLVLAGCGVADVGVATATNAKLQAEQAKQAKEQMDKMKQDLEAAAKANDARLKEDEAAK